MDISTRISDVKIDTEVQFPKRKRNSNIKVANVHVDISGMTQSKNTVNNEEENYSSEFMSDSSTTSDEIDPNMDLSNNDSDYKSQEEKQ